MKKGFILFAYLLAINLHAQTPNYLNTDLPIEIRVENLVSRMTLEEKVSQMLDQAPAIERRRKLKPDLPIQDQFDEQYHRTKSA
jgi:hypothetical protein